MKSSAGVTCWKIEGHFKQIRATSTLIFFHLQPTLAKPNGDKECMMGAVFGETGRF